MGISNRDSTLITMPAEAIIKNFFDVYLSDAQPPKSCPPTPKRSRVEFKIAAVFPINPLSLTKNVGKKSSTLLENNPITRLYRISIQRPGTLRIKIKGFRSVVFNFS